MTRNEFREKLYTQTGEWIEDDYELDEYMETLGYSLDDPNPSSHSTKYHNTTKDYYSFNDSKLYPDLDTIPELDELFSLLVKKSKSVAQSTLETIDWDEFVYYSKIFLGKSFLYFTLKSGISKGYKSRDL